MEEKDYVTPGPCYWRHWLNNFMMGKYVFFLLMLLTFKGVSQNDSLAFIRVISKVEQSNITLRWAPLYPHSLAFYLCQKGYSIERAVNKQGDSTMSAFVMLEPPENAWPKENGRKDQLASYDNYCIIAAEGLLYGKGTSVNANSKMLQNRWVSE